MKTWYNSSNIAKKVLHARYGSNYPQFWKEVIDWKGWRETRKLYLTHVEKEQKREKEQQQPQEHTKVKLESSADIPPPRKRKSRWGTAPASKATTTTSTTNSNSDSPPKRKSRWATRGRDPTPKPISGAVPNSNFNNGSVLDLLPGLPAQLTAAQSDQLKELQAQLRLANSKLETLEEDAKRVDALPVGHADRSPSPPPGT